MGTADGEAGVVDEALEGAVADGFSDLGGCAGDCVGVGDVKDERDDAGGGEAIRVCLLADGAEHTPAVLEETAVRWQGRCLWMHR